MELNTIYESVIFESGLPEILDQMSDYLVRALVLVDTGFRVIAHSERYTVTDSDWLDSIERGFCSYEMVVDIQKIPDTTSSEDPIALYIDAPAPAQKKLVIGIREKKHLIGYLILFSDTEPDDVLSGTLKKLAKVLAQAAKNSPEFSRILKDDIDKVLVAFLQGENPRELEMRLADLGYHLPASMCAAVCHPQGRSGSDIRYIIQYMRSEYPSCLCVHYKDCIYAVMNSQEAHDLPSLRRRSLERTAIVQMIGQIGVSDDFSDAESLPRCCRQARAALLFAIRSGYTKTLCRYSEFRRFDLFGHMEESVLKDSIEPSLYILRKYDQESGSELLKTLRLYFQFNCNIQDCADALYIHRNTLAYRLAKIRELTGKDLSLLSSKFELWLSLDILDYLNMS